MKLIEIHREDIESLPELMALLREAARASSCFATISSFDGDDTSYKSLKLSLKAVSKDARRTSYSMHLKRRHLMSRDMMENELSTAIILARRLRRKSRCRIASDYGLAFSLQPG